MKIRAFALLLLLVMAGCSTSPPIIEYTIARTALDSAKQVSAARYAPGYWHKAEQFYRQGEGFYRDEKFEKAAESFAKTRFFAEKAENIARLERLRTGEF